MLESDLYTLWRSPLGWMALAAGARGMLAISSPRHTRAEALAALFETAGRGGQNGVTDEIHATCHTLERYFRGDPTVTFEEVALEIRQATPFQRDVWQALREIPYGCVTTYHELARALGRPHAARAVGQCNARNPWAIVVPCHRVLGRDFALTGYAGGLDVKRRLLELEGIPVPASHATMLAAAPERRSIYAYRN